MSDHSSAEFARVKSLVSLWELAEAFSTERDRAGKIACPGCGSGTGPNGTSAFSITNDGNHWSCFHCQKGGDVFDLAAIVWDIDQNDRNAQLDAVKQWAGLADADSATLTPIGKPLSLAGGHQTAQETSNAESGTDTPERSKAADMTRHRAREQKRVEAARERIEDAREYIEARGFTVEQARAWGWGYEPESPSRAQDERGTWFTCPRLVIPYPGADYYHIDRATAPNVAARKYDKPNSSEVGPEPLWWPDGAKQSPVLFLVEGPLDAYALEAEGYKAIAVGGTATAAAVAGIKGRGFTGCIVIATDPDEAGEKAYAAAKAALEASEMPYTRLEWPKDGDAKLDACEMRRTNPDGFKKLVADAYGKADTVGEEHRAAEHASMMANLHVIEPYSTAREIYDCKESTPPTPTGFAELDSVMNGGLVDSRLYVLGAISSLGKTTLALQMADYIAEHGRPVLFVTIEQSARELVAKSLSRLTCETGGDFSRVSASDVDNPRQRAKWGESVRREFDRAFTRYNDEICPNMRMMEADGKPTPQKVEAVARIMADYYGVPPVVFVDYLQIIAPEDDKGTDKRATDDNVTDLRQAARRLQTPIIVISSLGRAAYYGPVDMTSFKESGSIEYGADVLLGLQVQGIKDEVKGKKEYEARRDAGDLIEREKAKEVRYCEIAVIKNRGGALPLSPIPCAFVAADNRFIFGKDAKRKRRNKAGI